MDDDPDLWSESYYDGELALRPFLRAWWREKMRALRSWWKYRVLRRPLPERHRPAPSATAATLNALYKQVYSEVPAADRPHPVFGAIKKVSTPAGIVSPIAFAMRAKDVAALCKLLEREAAAGVREVFVGPQLFGDFAKDTGARVEGEHFDRIRVATPAGEVWLVASSEEV